jgi:energy-coupling factor transporter transmembrane protein EcfT
VENRRNPLRRAVKLCVPIMSRVFEKSDQLALAMEARCYSERRTAPALRAARRDWLLFGLSCGWLAVVLAV